MPFYMFQFFLTAVADRIKRVLFHLELPLCKPYSVIHIERLLGRVWSNGERKEGGWWADCWNECRVAPISLSQCNPSLLQKPINALINCIIRLTGQISLWQFIEWRTVCVIRVKSTSKKQEYPLEKQWVEHLSREMTNDRNRWRRW